MGGRVALHFAAAHPTKVRRLILESASPGLGTEAERLERQANDEALACEKKHLVDIQEVKMEFQQKDIKQELRKRLQISI